MNTRRLTLLSLMVSLALVLSVVESWIPVTALVPVPGIKLGLANIITLMAILFFGTRDALLVVIVRCALASIFGGGLIIFFFSVTGGVLSALLMSLLYHKGSRAFSLIGVSVGGAVAHNIGQITVACAVMKTTAVLAYLPVLLASGIVMGCFVGICSSFLSKALKKTGIEKFT